MLLIGAVAAVAAVRVALDDGPAEEVARATTGAVTPAAAPPTSTSTPASTTSVPPTTSATTSPSTSTSTEASVPPTAVTTAGPTTTTRAATTTSTSAGPAPTTTVAAVPVRWPVRAVDGSLFVTIDASDPTPAAGQEVVFELAYEDHRGHLDLLTIDFGDGTSAQEDAVPRCAAAPRPDATYEEGTRTIRHRYGPAGDRVVVVRVVTDDCDGGVDDVTLRGRLTR